MLDLRNKALKMLLLVTWLPIFILAEVDAQPEVLFNKANELYRNQNFTEAAKLYEQLIKDGNISSEVYFNLGNAYYKSGKIESAILNYERARKFNAVDEDIDYNLRLANMQCIDKIEPIPQVFYQKWWNEFVRDSTPDIRAKSAMIALWMAALLIVVYLFARPIVFKKICFYSGLVALLISGWYFLLASKQNNLLNNRNEAIIFVSSDYVKSSPDEKSANLFMLHSGTKVEVLDQLKGWKKIRIANGNVGWIPEKSIERI